MKKTEDIWKYIPGYYLAKIIESIQVRIDQLIKNNADLTKN